MSTKSTLAISFTLLGLITGSAYSHVNVYPSGYNDDSNCYFSKYTGRYVCDNYYYNDYSPGYGVIRVDHGIQNYRGVKTFHRNSFHDGGIREGVHGGGRH